MTRQAPRPVEVHDGGGWRQVCDEGALTPGRGVAVLLGDEQIAVFRHRSGALYAVGNRDPFSGAYVISRGLLGSRGGTPTVISPMYKQAWDLRDGRCLDEDEAPGGSPAALRVWPVRRAPAAPPPTGPTAASHTAGGGSEGRGGAGSFPCLSGPHDLEEAP